MNILNTTQRKLIRAKATVALLEKKVQTLVEEGKSLERLAEGTRLYLDLKRPYGKNKVEIPKGYKSFFYRYGLENGITEARLHEYTGAHKYNSSLASHLRRELIRECAKRPETMEEWHRFKNYVDNSTEEFDLRSTLEEARRVWKVANQLYPPKTAHKRMVRNYLFVRWAAENGYDSTQIREVTNQRGKGLQSVLDSYKEFFNKEADNTVYKRKESWKEFQELINEVP